MPARRTPRLATVALLVLALAAAHCGGDDDAQLVAASAGNAGQSSGGRGGSGGDGGAHAGGPSHAAGAGQGGSGAAAGTGGSAGKGGGKPSGEGGGAGTAPDDGVAGQGGAAGNAGGAGAGAAGSAGQAAAGQAGSAGNAGASASAGNAGQAGQTGVAGQAGQTGVAGQAGESAAGAPQGGGGGAAGQNGGAGNAQGGGAQGGGAGSLQAGGGGGSDGGQGGAAGTGGAPSGPPHLIISEVRTRGSNGGLDELVEIFNPTDQTVTFDASWSVWGRSASGACQADVKRFSGPKAGKLIPPRGSLVWTASGYDDAVPADGSWSGQGFGDSSSVFLTYNGGVQDALCFAHEATDFNRFVSCPGFTCEGTPIVNGPHDDDSNSQSNVDVSLSRKKGPGAGQLLDTGNTLADFEAVPSSPRNLAAGPLP